MRRRATGMATGVMLNSRSPRPIEQSDQRQDRRPSRRTPRRDPTAALPRDAPAAAAAATAGMQRLVEIGHAFVGAIDGQRVLDEIVGADGEEVGLLRQQVGGQRRRRHLDHRADRDGARLAEFLGHVAHHGAGRPHLLDRRHEREHDAELPVRRGAQQRPQLRAQHVGVRQAESQTAAARSRVAAVATGPSRELAFVEVEGADRDPPWCDRDQQVAVDLRTARSSVSRSADRSASRNSERKRPMPSAPASSRAGTSSGRSRFASSRMRDAVGRQGRRRQRPPRRAALTLAAGPSRAGARRRCRRTTGRW